MIMNIYIYHISLTNYIILEKIEVNNKVILKFERVEIGPLKRPNPYTVELIKNTISDIPSEPVQSNRWIDYSNWQDFHGILRSGTKLSLHSVISRIEDKFKLLTNCYLDLIDENGNIIINLYEMSTTIHQEFKITARRKRLRRLEHIAAFNVARKLSSEADVQELPLPKTMEKFINMYIDTFSIDLYIDFICLF